MGLTTGLGWRAGCTILLLALIQAAEINAVRPEIILADVLARPFVPREWASPECIRDSAIYLKELEKYTPWALRMYDASVKIPVALITGNYKQLGNFDECLSIKNDHGFVGQACYPEIQFEITADNNTGHRDKDLGDLLVNVAIASNTTEWTSGKSVVYEWMWCVPSTCNHTEIQEALEIALDSLKVEGRVDMIINVPKESCYTVETVRTTWDIFDYCYISILILYALIIISSTGYDIARRCDLSQTNVFKSFSLYTNGKNLLRTDRRPGSIGCLDGLRYLSICWIIFGHTYYMEAVSVKMNLTQIPRMHHDWSNMLVLNANIVTDTFFLLSGILLAYTELSKKENSINWRFDILGLYLHRYLRLTPAYAMMIGFYATLFYKFGTGPRWDTWVGSNRNFCRESWWTNLLYINNYVKVPSMCMSQSWYLSIDMQLVWLSPLILYPMLKFRRLFFVIFGIGLLLSVLVPFVVTYALELTGTMLYYKEQMDVTQVYLEIYTKVYNRFGPYVMGLGLGYLLHQTRSYNVNLPVWCVICGWLTAIIAGLSVVFGPRGMYFDTYVYNRLEASLYAGFHRPAFALAVAWIIFCCVHGYAGPVNYFLSWHGWMPLGKLSYCAYLSHYVFLLSDVGSIRTAGILTPMNVVRAFFANLVFTMILSALWTLCFEMPFVTIDRALFSWRKQESSEHNRHYTMEFRNEVYTSKDELSTSYDSENPNRATSITRHNSVKNLVGAKENSENSATNINDETELNPRKVYVIDTTDFDNTSGVIPIMESPVKTSRLTFIATYAKTKN